VDTSQLHNDSTSISVHGAYHDADGTARAGKATPVITHGHSKDLGFPSNRGDFFNDGLVSCSVASVGWGRRCRRRVLLW